MTGKTKIMISEPELELVMNSEWILTKTRIIARVYELFAAQAEQIRGLIREFNIELPEAIQDKSPRIYKGEQYKGLPYVILDYPVLFSKEDMFAMRTMFWWGNYFSIELQLAGKFKEVYQDNILKSLIGATTDFHICISADQWDHDVASGNFTTVQEMSDKDIENLAGNKFLKLVLTYELKYWNNISELFRPGYTEVLKLLKN